MKKRIQIRQRTHRACCELELQKSTLQKFWMTGLLFVFNKIKEFIPEGTPIICESPVLRYYIEPGAFLIISSETTNKHKDISKLLELPHVMF